MRLDGFHCHFKAMRILVLLIHHRYPPAICVYCWHCNRN